MEELAITVEVFDTDAAMLLNVVLAPSAAILLIRSLREAQEGGFLLLPTPTLTKYPACARRGQ